MRKKIDCLSMRCFAMLLLMFLSLGAFAQKRVTGTVFSAKDNQPVNGATVLVKGTTIGVTTTTDGAFAINVPSGSNTLVVSYVGYADQEVDVTNTATANVTLRERASSLDEVVVTGYTAQKKKDITGSVAVVNVTS